jgi:hypothetical protein
MIRVLRVSDEHSTSKQTDPEIHSDERDFGTLRLVLGAAPEQVEEAKAIAAGREGVRKFSLEV